MIQDIPYDPTTVSTTDASDLASVILLANDLKTKYNDMVDVNKLLLAALRVSNIGGGLDGN